MTAASFYDLKAKKLDGQEYDFSQLKGKVVLIVNVASKCGFTNQYKGLEELWQKYQNQNVVILGFPCNQFGGQEPGNADEIANFCSLTYQVTFPIMEKIDVNGDNESPVYAYLKDHGPKTFGFIGRVKWNFEKFLVDQEGKVVNRFWSNTSPESIGADIEKLLAQK
ncbi:thioredoxin-like protein [Dimargaris cristalligena]|uniref:Glutathione peroxidase n=1 Tax=Dimargaris cristalligena TaxID=215637 RepID=A0A4P9ZNG3_9FUNG|nr:thioredoxin-like protein [Dimargaris cristalligena]|eukprot:RKP34956.1 thioredoxin-like protein [Dimargaris cristalligena]